ARGDEVALAVDDQQIDGGSPPFTGGTAAHLEHARAPDADAAPGESGDGGVEDVLGEPVRLDVMGCGLVRHRWLLAACESSALDIEHRTDEMTSRQERCSHFGAMICHTRVMTDSNISSQPRVAGARERARAEVRSEILAAARARVAIDGAAGLSLRAVARD